MKVQQWWCSDMVHIILFILGCCIGSFINVIFTREDWYKGRSRCDECGYILKWYDLIPVVSFIMLGGKCRRCKTKIDYSHLVSELMMGATFLVGSFCFARYGVLYGVFISTSLFSIAVAAIEDYKEQMVYSFILTGGIILTTCVRFGYLLYFGCYIDAINLIGSVFILKLLALLASLIFVNKIGSGDFDILIIIYIIGGVSGILISVISASVIGCLIYLPPIVLKKRDKKEPLPFIPLLLLGTMCFLVI